MPWAKRMCQNGRAKEVRRLLNKQDSTFSESSFLRRSDFCGGPILTLICNRDRSGGGGDRNAPTGDEANPSFPKVAAGTMLYGVMRLGGKMVDAVSHTPIAWPGVEAGSSVPAFRYDKSIR